MSLRTRLVGGLVALVAIGLVTMAAITYIEQRNFQLDRADDQARAAAGFVERELSDSGGLKPPGGPGGGPGGGGPGGGPGATLPPGTYGELRDSSGKVVNSGGVGFDDTNVPNLDLPDNLPLNETVSYESGGVEYRVYSRLTRDGETVVVALPLSDVDETLDRLLLVEGLVVIGITALIAAGAWWLVGIGLRPLDRMGAVAGKIAAGDLTRRVEPAEERTEVGRLGMALNGMLTQIEKAFAEREASEGRLRRFIADASHELRTPLASIRGYAELFRMGAAADPEGASKAMTRIEDESKRMGVLVEDLLTLARLDQLPELAREPVELSVLGRDAVDDARAAAPDREISLEGDDDVVVRGDASRLRQVISNLTRNALVHTPAGTPVEVRVARDGGAAVLSVRDHGNGLPTDDTDALFERFWRAEGGRKAGPAGAGLGLSIVRAIVTSHGGTVSAANADGGGAEFTVRLPLA
jgi:two-component system OmpR family sensor kinase